MNPNMAHAEAHVYFVKQHRCLPELIGNKLHPFQLLGVVITDFSQLLSVCCAEFLAAEEAESRYMGNGCLPCRTAWESSAQLLSKLAQLALNAEKTHQCARVCHEYRVHLNVHCHTNDVVFQQLAWAMQVCMHG